MCHELTNINISVRSQNCLVFNNILFNIKLLQHILQSLHTDIIERSVHADCLVALATAASLIAPFSSTTASTTTTTCERPFNLLHVSIIIRLGGLGRPNGRIDVEFKVDIEILIGPDAFLCYRRQYSPVHVNVIGIIRRTRLVSAKDDVGLQTGNLRQSKSFRQSRTFFLVGFDGYLVISCCTTAGKDCVGPISTREFILRPLNASAATTSS